MDDLSSAIAAAPAPPPPRPRRFFRRLGTRVLIYASLAYVAWCAALYFYQDHLVFPADMAPPPLKGAPVRAVVSRLDLPTGGTTEAWFLPAPGVSAQKPGPVVVFLHGNAEIIDYQDGLVSSYHQWGCSVLLPEYRGYGRAAGQPSEAGIVADTVHFYDEMVSRSDVDRSRIVFHGRSLGGGVAAQLAARRKPAAMIIESSFSSVAVMAHDYWAPSFLATSPFRTDRVIGGMDIPLLIFHGTQDAIIPVAHARRLHELAPHSVLIEYPCGHNDFPCPENSEAYRERIERFLSGAGIIR